MNPQTAIRQSIKKSGTVSLFYLQRKCRIGPNCAKREVENYEKAKALKLHCEGAIYKIIV